MILNVIILWGLAVFSVTDHRNHVIPNKLLALLLMICAVVVGIDCLVDIESGIYLAGQCLLGGLISGIVFFVCYFLSKKTAWCRRCEACSNYGIVFRRTTGIECIFIWDNFLLCVFIDSGCQKKTGLEGWCTVGAIPDLGNMDYLSYFIN